MLWIRQVEMVDSVEDLKTSRSIGAHRFPNFEMLDAKIASSLKKITTNPYFKKKDNLEEQKAQMQDRILRGRQIAFSINKYFRMTGAHEAVLHFTGVFSISLHGGDDDVQDLDARSDQALLSTSEVPKDREPEDHKRFWNVRSKCENESLIHSEQYWQCTKKKSIKFDQSRAIRS